MTKTELITRLTHELYDLKHKLEDIRIHAETAQFNLRRASPNGYLDDAELKTALSAVIDIVNLVDTSEEYFNEN